MFPQSEVRMRCRLFDESQQISPACSHQKQTPESEMGLLPVPPAIRARLQSRFNTWMNLQHLGAHSDSMRYIISIESVGSDSTMSTNIS